MSERLSKEIIGELNDAWLNIQIKNSDVINPFEILRTDDPDEFHMKFTWLLMNPEYFCFICKHILNIDLLPMQALILREMWIRKFPMLVGSRGLGKAISIVEPILTDRGWIKMGDIKIGDKVYSRDGSLCNVTQIYPQGKKQKCRLKFSDGRQIDCCEDHLWVMKHRNKEINISTKEIIKKGTKHISPSGKWIYKFALPNCDPIQYSKNKLPIDPYIVGCLLGDGTCTTLTPKIASSDQFIVDEFKSILTEFDIKPDTSNNNWTIVDKNTKCEDCSCGSKHRNSLTAKMCKLGINVGCKDKFIPEIYKTSSIDDRLSLIQGLMDTDGSINKDGSIEFSNTSESLVNDVIDVLRSLGITCIKKLDDSRLGEDFILPGGRLSKRGSYFRVYINTSKKIFRLPRKANRLKTNISTREKYVSLISAEYTDEYDEMQCISVDSHDHTYITKDYIVTHNTFILSVYCLLRALLIPKRKIVVVGSAFRQSKYLHDYMENIWRNAPILQDLCDENSGPKRDVDMCKITLNGSTVSSLPIGDGCLNSSSMITTKNNITNIKNIKGYVWGDGIYRKIDYFIDNGVKPTKIVKTKSGYSYEGTYNHAMKVLSDGNIIWKKTDEMKIGDRILIDRSVRWLENPYYYDTDEAYALGAMIGDGSWTDKYKLGFASKDIEIVNRLNIGVARFGLNFKQSKDLIHWNACSKNGHNEFIDFWDLEDLCYTKDKSLPNSILCGSKDSMSACLQGLFDTDGHVFTSKVKGGISASVHFTNTSETLVKQIHYILLHYGIVSKLTSRQRGRWSRVYELGIYGHNTTLFYEKIGFFLSRKREKLKSAILSKTKKISFGDSIPLEASVVLEAANKAGYTKAKIKKLKSYQFSFLEKIYEHLSDDIKPLVNKDIFYDTIESIEDSECYTCDIHVPEGNEYCTNGFFSHNSKIRGQRANDIIADEFASMSREIFENVIAGFAAVSASPAENVKRIAKEKRAKELGVSLDSIKDDMSELNKSNQIILSGTAYYDFNHFAEYWKRWKAIISTNGDMRKIQNEVFNGEPVPESFNYADYSILRIPVDLVPKGFMDEGQIARSRATIHNGIYLMEFGACFTKDSQGFFKRSLIESCVGTDINPVKLRSGDVYFQPLLKGSTSRKYVMGVDPASERDNFSIVVLELYPDHRRVVYCWTTTRKEHIERVKKGLTQEDNFYSYCARKIRELMDLFPICHIAMDAQGGGISVSEALHDSKALKPGETPIWPIIDEDDPKESDGKAGLHILELCQFAKYDWYSEANHGLRKDFEDKQVIFPMFDPITIGLSIEEDKVKNRLYDTLEDCVMDIEELKNELCLIEMTQTATGRDRWDTPEIKIGVGKKEKMRKDRYSALLMANMAARLIYHADVQQPYISYGGFAGYVSNKDVKVEYIGPAWFTEGMRDVY